MIRDRSDGYSLVELLVALVWTMVVVAASVAIVDVVQDAAASTPEAIDQLQRVRIGADALWHDLENAGAGFDSGPLAGPLSRRFPAVYPRRLGARSADPPTSAGNQTITILTIPRSMSQARIATNVGAVALQLQLTPAPNCPPLAALCGFTAGDGVLLANPTQPDQFDVFTIASLSGSSGTLTVRSSGPPGSYAAGSWAAAVEMHTYYFDDLNRQLRSYDGNATDVPVIDHVVQVTFEYFGDANPPVRPKPPDGQANCLYDASGFLLPLPILSVGTDGLAALPPAMLADGPWCGSGAQVFDADLLRIRRVRVTLRLEAESGEFRGQGSDFLHPGIANRQRRWVRDLVSIFDVAPRNLVVHDDGMW